MKLSQKETIKLPKVFFTDHKKRGCPSPKIIDETEKHFIVSASDAGLYDLLSDAKHYRGSSEYDFGLVSSARATAKAIYKSLEETGIELHRGRFFDNGSIYTATLDGKRMDIRFFEGSGKEVDSCGNPLEEPAPFEEPTFPKRQEESRGNPVEEMFKRVFGCRGSFPQEKHN